MDGFVGSNNGIRARVGDAVRASAYLREKRIGDEKRAAPTGAQANDDFEDSELEYRKHAKNTDEKDLDGKRLGVEAKKIRVAPSAQAIYTLDWGLGDGITQARVLKAIHEEHGNLPIVSISKEFNGDNLLNGFQNLVTGLADNPGDVLVATNMGYKVVAGLNTGAAQNFEWKVIKLKGDSVAEFQTQITAELQTSTGDKDSWIKEHWRLKPNSGVHDHPAVVVAYRDAKVLERIIPKKGDTIEGYNFVNLTQAYRLSRKLDFKVQRVLAPGLERLAPGGVGVVIQAADNENGQRIIGPLGWKDLDPFRNGTPEDLGRAVIAELTTRGKADGLSFNSGENIKYHIHQLQVNNKDVYDEAALRTVFDAVVYHYQQTAQIAREAVTSGNYKEPTREALIATGGRFGFANNVVTFSRTPDWS